MHKENILCKMLEIKWPYYFKINASELAETSAMQNSSQKKTTFKFLSLVLFVTWVAIHRYFWRVLKKLQKSQLIDAVCVLQ